MNKPSEIVAENWYTYINHEYYLFRGETRKTISDFADWFDMPQGQLSQYMKKGGRVPQGLTVINRFAKKLGPKVYEVLNLPVPSDPIDSLPEPVRSIAFEIRETLAEYKVAGDSPKALEIQEEILKKYGYDVISKND
ncbi:MAG: hypothetical protein CVU43_04675 [Chloroflexi bacterium HGW-Chloroflexi-5]|jgi:hypothetical protein|nr:MAG: hypothetical protein CVU43_04675 [Chloroflexi bacterium HGW-Chloroflexi-5]